MPNITTNHDITCTNFGCNLEFLCIVVSIPKILGFLSLRKIAMERSCRNFQPSSSYRKFQAILILLPRTNRFFTELLNNRQVALFIVQKKTFRLSHLCSNKDQIPVAKANVISVGCTQCVLKPKLKGVEVLVIWTSRTCAQNRLTTLS